FLFFFFQAEDGIRDFHVTGVQTCALPICITGQVAQTGVAEIVTDTTKDPRYIADDQIRLSEITVPILLDKEVLGIIDCEHPRAHYFTKQHLRLLTGIANLCAVSIQNLRNNDHIKEEQKKRFLLQQE